VLSVVIILAVSACGAAVVTEVQNRTDDKTAPLEQSPGPIPEQVADASEDASAGLLPSGEPREDCVCGDWVRCRDESCDDGNNGNPCDECLDGCIAHFNCCGDRFLCNTESCDDGFNDECGSCNTNCTGAGIGAICGDNDWCPESEPCDDGDNGDPCDGCLDGCILHTNSCGDGNACAPEGCDDGNNEREECPWTAEPANCTVCGPQCYTVAGIPNYCGDGKIDADEDSAATGIHGNPSNNGAPDAGAAYLFVRRRNNSWAQQAYLKASNTDGGDVFGYSVSISDDGDTLVVGADFEDSAATGKSGNPSNNGAPDAGAAYLF
jgi:hypothetical protein